VWMCTPSLRPRRGSNSPPCHRVLSWRLPCQLPSSSGEGSPAWSSPASLRRASGEYLPIKPSDVERWEINPNPQVPLFIKTSGAWPNRPRPTSPVRHLDLAGDFVTQGIDLACMEGAVCAALAAAGEILGDAGATAGLPVPRLPPGCPRGLLVAARLGCAPVVALGRPLAWVAEPRFPRRPEASAVRQRAAPRRRQDPRPTRKRHTPTEVNRRSGLSIRAVRMARGHARRRE
jgi:hypothetical protein